MDQSPERKLVAIMFTDIVDFTDLMGKNKSEAFELINTKLIKPINLISISLNQSIINFNICAE